MSVSTSIPPSSARPAGSVHGQGEKVTIGDVEVVGVKEWSMPDANVPPIPLPSLVSGAPERRPRLSEEQRRLLILNVRESWARVDAGNPVIVEPVIVQDVPDFNRPRRRISLQDE